MRMLYFWLVIFLLEERLVVPGRFLASAAVGSVQGGYLRNTSCLIATRLEKAGLIYQRGERKGYAQAGKSQGFACLAGAKCWLPELFQGPWRTSA